MAGILNEFDKELPSPSCHCRRISVADYDREGAEETQSELEKLLEFMDDNPEVYYKAVRKRKRDELDLFKFVKVKVMSVVKGEVYLQNYFSEKECKTQLDHWKSESIAAFDFGQEAVGSKKRFSRRLAAKRKLNGADRAKPHVTTPTVPPPPPPPPVFQTPNHSSQKNEEDVENRSPTERESSSTIKSDINSTSHLKINEELFRSIRNVSGRGEKTSKISNCPVEDQNNDIKQSKVKTMKKTLSKKLNSLSNLQKNLNDEITNGRKKLKCINSQTSSPGGTPYQVSKARRVANSTPEEYPMFNVALVHKFRNTRSPTPSPSGYFNSSTSSFCDSSY